MITIAVIAILAAVVVPNFFSSRPRQRLRKAAQDMVGAMQNSRLEAIKNNTSWALYFHNRAGALNDAYQIVSCGTNATCPAYADPLVLDVDDTIIRTVSLANYGSQIQFGDDVGSPGTCGNATSMWAMLPAPPGAISQRTTLTYSNRGLSNAGATYLTNINNSLCFSVATTMAGGKRLRVYNGITPFNVNNWTD